jgi:hypothetical protein
MKLLNTVLLLVLLSGCGQDQMKVNEKSRKIGIHIFTSGMSGDKPSNWYYIKNIHGAGNKGYYFESKKPVENFSDADFVYLDSRPDKLNELYLVKEKIILVYPKDLPENVQHNISELESLSVRK